jgi:predicted SAM-dependent methyltransferase
MNIFRRKVFDNNRIAGKTVLDIGCGRHKLSGAIGVDFLNLPGVDCVADLNERIPFDDISFDVVHADQVFEHIQNIWFVIDRVFSTNKINITKCIFTAY